MKLRHALLSLAIATSLVPGTLAAQKAPRENADQFVARINAEMKAMYPEITVPQWLASTYIGEDTQMLAAKSNERWLTRLNQWIEAAKQYEGKPMSAESARTIALLKLSATMPPPKDPAALSELTQIATRLEGAYGAGSYCQGEGEAKTCRQLGELEEVLRGSRDYAAQLDAWQGWHGVAAPMRKDYQRFVELANQGANDLGFTNVGELWRSGYDMKPAEIAAETDRLWAQVKPLYEELHCYARNKLEAKYPGQGSVAGGLLPAHLMGNMWQQDWGNLWDVLEPYPGAGSLDISSTLEAQYQAALQAEQAKPAGRSADDIEQAAKLKIAQDMTRRAEDFYTSIGFPKLPESYWQNSQFIKPRDRDVVCHASAWDMNMQGDVRTKMCIKPNEEDFTTIYHELGHIYYDLAYNVQPALFQAGAHDGFHEAIGDVIVLAMTPDYLQSIGLVGKQSQSQQALINSQMRMALAKVAFLPFGLMIDRWRWGVFDGTIQPGQYNAAWWNLKARYQGVAPVSPRGEEYFDAGAKYHVPGNTPYLRYFLSHILQFQFYKSLCDAAGHNGPLYQCSFYGNKDAGQRYWAMLSKGASQPWQNTLQELTGGQQMDASAVLEYFAPLQTWLKEQNQGQQCGWQAPN
ncbi:MAG: M2 family metallopeptidase [Pseudomonadota bacterium]|nr:M2 family metallopeptidase [Pseudomonadota bacterium]